MIAVTQAADAATGAGTFFGIAMLAAIGFSAMLIVVWTIFPLIVWAKMNEQIKLLKQMTK
ncbi:MAG: hypothetical protein WCE87_00550 [Candidatus Udaeobacter sp.]